jgi:KH domain-containing protein
MNMEEQMQLEGKAAAALRSKKIKGKSAEIGVKFSVHGNAVEFMYESALDASLFKSMVNALNAGFDQNAASLLLDYEYDFMEINLSDYLESKNRQTDIKGRIIGTRGLIKQRLIKATGCYIKVGEKTIDIIGPSQRLSVAFHAIEMLMHGAKHDNVFRMIEKENAVLETYGNS